MTERMVTEAHWAYYAFPIPNGETVERGKLAVIDTANGGIVTKARAATGLIPIGIFHETVTGDGTKRAQVKLHREIQATWWQNDTVAPVTAADRGKLCALKDDQTVSIDATGRSDAGLILDVDARKGVLVHFDFKAW